MKLLRRRRLIALSILLIFIALGVLFVVRLEETFAPPSPTEADSQCGVFPPRPDCTGARLGRDAMVLRANDRFGNYRVKNAGAVLENVVIDGGLLVLAPNVRIRNVWVKGSIQNVFDGKSFPMTIDNSTVGVADRCVTSPAIGSSEYTASHVLIRGHDDGFRVSGGAARVTTSFVELCENPSSHSDGIQDFPQSGDVQFVGNTVDARAVKVQNSPVYITAAESLVVEGNLLIGGGTSIRVENRRDGSVKVIGNMIVDRSWVYRPVISQCSNIEWRDNVLVDLGEGYRIEGLTRPLDCAS